MRRIKGWGILAAGLAGAAALVAMSACTHMPAMAGNPHEVAADAPYIAAAVNDSRRPQADKDRDALRKPADMLAFAQIRPGQKVADLIPGGGYFTRLFAVAVGPQGHVYSTTRPPPPTATNPPAIVAVGAQYPNDSVVLTDFNAITWPERLDMVWTSQNYHDMKIVHNNIDTAAVNRAVFNALKPGGIYIVLDHSAPDGSGITLTEQLHRIDQAYVRHEVEAAGFVYDGETQVLRNPADTRTTPVFDAAIRAHTDQFVMRFRKPG
jgi:predicted methyltransferase